MGPDPCRGGTRRRSAPTAKEAVPKIVRLLWEYGPDFEVAKSLGRIGPDAALAVPPLLFFLDVAEPSERDEIRQAIDRIMPRTPGATIAGSIAAMKASDPAARFRAAYELGRLIEKPPHPAEGVAALAEAMGDPDPLVRRTAAAMLCRLGSGGRARRAGPDPRGPGSGRVGPQAHHRGPGPGRRRVARGHPGADRDDEGRVGRRPAAGPPAHWHGPAPGPRRPPRR